VGNVGHVLRDPLVGKHLADHIDVAPRPPEAGLELLAPIRLVEVDETQNLVVELDRDAVDDLGRHFLGRLVGAGLLLGSEFRAHLRELVNGGAHHGLDLTARARLPLQPRLQMQQVLEQVAIGCDQAVVALDRRVDLDQGAQALVEVIPSFCLVAVTVGVQPEKERLLRPGQRLLHQRLGVHGGLRRGWLRGRRRDGRLGRRLGLADMCAAGESQDDQEAQQDIRGVQRVFRAQRCLPARPFPPSGARMHANVRVLRGRAAQAGPPGWGTRAGPAGNPPTRSPLHRRDRGWGRDCLIYNIPI